MKAVLVLSLIASGYWLGKMRQKKAARATAWLLVPIAVASAESLTALYAPWYRMVAFIVALFLAMKGVAHVYRYGNASRLSFLQWLLFLSWPGMDAGPFEQFGKKPLGDRESLNDVKRGTLSLLVGAAMLIVIALSLKPGYLPDHLFCLLTFPAFIMIFHGGIFDWGVAVCRNLGIQVQPLMNAPWKARSLSEFWGRRWNVAFIQMTQITVFLPLARALRPQWALLLSFFVSGIFHEVAISLPVMEGFGLPTAYFTLQGVLVMVERRLGIQDARLARAWTVAALLLPFPLLFHTSFLYQIVWPLMLDIARYLDNLGLSM